MNQTLATLRVRSAPWPLAGAVRTVQTGCVWSIPQGCEPDQAQIAWPRVQ